MSTLSHLFFRVNNSSSKAASRKHSASLKRLLKSILTIGPPEQFKRRRNPAAQTILRDSGFASGFLCRVEKYGRAGHSCRVAQQELFARGILLFDWERHGSRSQAFRACLDGKPRHLARRVHFRKSRRVFDPHDRRSVEPERYRRLLSKRRLTVERQLAEIGAVLRAAEFKYKTHQNHLVA